MWNKRSKGHKHRHSEAEVLENELAIIRLKNVCLSVCLSNSVLLPLLLFLKANS